MSNGTTPAQQPSQMSWQFVAMAVVQLMTLIFTTYSAQLNTRTHSRIEQVEQNQVTQEDVSTKVREKLDAKLELDERQQGITLYSTWKYLEDVAEVSGLMKDKLKAAEAQKLYEEHVRKRNGKH